MAREQHRLNNATGPATEPVTTSGIKTHLRIDGSDEDTLLATFITAAREYVEQVTGRALITQTWEQWHDYFLTEFEIPKPPLISISSITYIDSAGATQVLATSVYSVDTSVEPGLVYKAYNQDWPSTRDVRNAIKITFVAGYGAASDVPEPIIQAIKLLIGHWYENRENSASINVNDIPMGVNALLAPYRRVPM